MLGVQVGNYIRKLQLKHFELGERPNRLLARQLKVVQADSAIHKISSATGQLITDPKLINDRFLNFFISCTPPNLTLLIRTQQIFSNSLNFPTLNETAKVELDSDITREEIRSFPNGKACGPDGFGIDFYKKQIDHVAPPYPPYDKLLCERRNFSQQYL